MKLRKLALACAAIPAALFLTGCGSDDSSSSGTQFYSHAQSAPAIGGSVPVNYYNINGGSFTPSSENAVLNFYATGGAVAAGSEVSELLPTQNGSILVALSALVTSGSGALVITDYNVGSNNVLTLNSTVSQTGTVYVRGVNHATVGQSTVSSQTKSFAVFTGAGVDVGGSVQDEGSLGVVVPAGTTFSGSDQVTTYTLATSGGSTAGLGESYNAIAINSSSSQSQPVIYMGSQSGDSIQQCELTFNSNFVPSLAVTSGGNTCISKDTTSLGAPVGDLAVAQSGVNVVVLADLPNSNILVSCPASNWEVPFGDGNCDLIDVTYPDGTTGNTIYDINLNASRTQIFINTEGNTGTDAMVQCDINSTGTQITNCQLPKNSGSALNIGSNEQNTAI
ncbi:hypothetical protein OAO18_01310 [Francisellaceae bacterium]|nr:hypothetical protein [Francisellaceae bacterium]